MRCFIAIGCSGGVRSRLSEVQEDVGDFGRLKMVKQVNMHLTLKFLGEVEVETSSQVQEVLAEIEVEPFELEVRGLGVFPKPAFPKVFWAGVGKGAETVSGLHKQVDGLTKPLGFELDKRFHPHYTIARVKNIREQLGFLDYIAQNKETVYGSFIVDKILFMKSILTPTGPEYTILNQ